MINSNFSYGVKINFARKFREVITSVLRKHGSYLISKHPVDDTFNNDPRRYPITAMDFYTAVEKADWHISRFATGVIESIALGTKSIYANIVEEKNQRFLTCEHGEELQIVSSDTELHAALHQPPTLSEADRKRYLQRNIRYNGIASPAQLIATVISNLNLAVKLEKKRPFERLLKSGYNPYRDNIFELGKTNNEMECFKFVISPGTTNTYSIKYTQTTPPMPFKVSGVFLAQEKEDLLRLGFADQPKTKFFIHKVGSTFEFLVFFARSTGSIAVYQEGCGVIGVGGNSNKRLFKDNDPLCLKVGSKERMWRGDIDIYILEL
jgi:hypothetical protein